MSGRSERTEPKRLLIALVVLAVAAGAVVAVGGAVAAADGPADGDTDVSTTADLSADDPGVCLEGADVCVTVSTPDELVPFGEYICADDVPGLDTGPCIAENPL